MPPNDRLERLKKLKVLAERGSPGEKDNAKMILEKMCRKYQISPDQIESSDELKMHWFRHRRDKIYDSLLSQCIFKTLGDGKRFVHGKHLETGAICTAAEAMEIELDYAFYCAAFDEEVKRLLYFFIQKNSIFPPDVEEAEVESKLTESDIQMYMSIKKQSRTLAITGGKDRLK